MVRPGHVPVLAACVFSRVSARFRPPSVARRRYPCAQHRAGGTVLRLISLWSFDAHGRHLHPPCEFRPPTGPRDGRCRRYRAAAARVAGGRARSRQHRGRCRGGHRRGGQHLDLADRHRRAAHGPGPHRTERPGPQGPEGRQAAASARLAVRGVLRRVLQEPPRPGRDQGRRPFAAPGEFARLRLRHRRARHRGHQQSRHRGRRRDHRGCSTTARSSRPN